MVFDLCIIFLTVFILLDIYFYKKLPDISSYKELPRWAKTEIVMITMIPGGAMLIYYLLKRRRML